MHGKLGATLSFYSISKNLSSRLKWLGLAPSSCPHTTLDILLTPLNLCISQWKMVVIIQQHNNFQRVIMKIELDKAH